MPVGVALDISRSPIENKWGSLWCPGWLDRYAFEMLTLPNDGWKVINRWGWGVAGLMNWSPLLTLWVVLMTTCGATGGGGTVGLAMFCFQWWSYWICFSCMYILYQDAIKHLFILSYLILYIYIYIYIYFRCVEREPHGLFVKLSYYPRRWK